MKFKVLFLASLGILMNTLVSTSARADLSWKPGWHYAKLINNKAGAQSMYIGRWHPNGLPGTGRCFNVGAWQTMNTNYLIQNGDTIGYWSFPQRDCGGLQMKANWNAVHHDNNPYWNVWY